MMVTAAHWVHRFNHCRLHQYCGDIPPVELEAATTRCGSASIRLTKTGSIGPSITEIGVTSPGRG
jgi:hypothetical protein